MFDYGIFTKLVPSMCDTSSIRYASTRRKSPNLLSYLETVKVNTQGIVPFYEEGDICIVIVYGEAPHLMYHDIIDDKHTFCICADYLVKEKSYVTMFHMIHGIVKHVLSYTNIVPNKGLSPSFIKDTYAKAFDSDVMEVCIYSVWRVFGASFLEEFKKEYPEFMDLDIIIQSFEDVEMIR